MYTDPQVAVNQLGGVHFKVLEQLIFLSGLGCRFSARQARYTVCSQQWLAKRLGVCRETVNRAVQDLIGWGHVRVIHRRKVQGHWSTNVTVVKTWLARKVGKGVQAVRNHVRKKSHIAPPKGAELSAGAMARPLERESSVVPEESKVALRALIEFSESLSKSSRLKR